MTKAKQEKSFGFHPTVAKKFAVFDSPVWRVLKKAIAGLSIC